MVCYRHRVVLSTFHACWCMFDQVLTSPWLFSFVRALQSFGRCGCSVKLSIFLYHCWWCSNCACCMHIRKDVQSCDSLYRTCRTDLPHCVERTAAILWLTDGRSASCGCVVDVFFNIYECCARCNNIQASHHIKSCKHGVICHICLRLFNIRRGLAQLCQLCWWICCWASIYLWYKGCPWRRRG